MQYLISGLLVSTASAVLLAFINSAIHGKMHAWLHAVKPSTRPRPTPFTNVRSSTVSTGWPNGRFGAGCSWPAVSCCRSWRC